MRAPRAQGLDDLRRGRGIAKRHREVAQPAFVPAAADRGAFGAAQELVFVPGEQRGQRGPVEVVARAEVGFVGAPRELVPGARQLAVVATEDAVADQRAQFFVDAARVLDGQVADAAPGVHAVGRDDRAGRADVDAARAGPAMRAGGRVDRQRQVDEQFAEEEPAAAIAIDQAAVLADPAEPGVARECAFQHRRGIDEHAMAERPDGRRHRIREALQAVSHELVVIATQRIAGHVGAFAVVQVGPGRRLVLAVVEADRHHPQRARHQGRRLFAQFAMARHPVHRPVLALRQPVAQVGDVVAELDAGDPDPLEPGLGGERADPRGQRGGVGRGDRHACSIGSRSRIPGCTARSRCTTPPRCGASKPAASRPAMAMPSP